MKIVLISPEPIGLGLPNGWITSKDKADSALVLSAPRNEEDEPVSPESPYARVAAIAAIDGRIFVLTQERSFSPFESLLSFLDRRRNLLKPLIDQALAAGDVDHYFVYVASSADVALARRLDPAKTTVVHCRCAPETPALLRIHFPGASTLTATACGGTDTMGALLKLALAGGDFRTVTAGGAAV
jgi:hypothetical protein